MLKILRHQKRRKIRLLLSGKNYIKFSKLPPLKHYYTAEYTLTSLQFTSPKFHSYIGLHTSFSFACSYLVLRPNDKSGYWLELLCRENIKRIIWMQPVEGILVRRKRHLIECITDSNCKGNTYASNKSNKCRQFVCEGKNIVQRMESSFLSTFHFNFYCSYNANSFGTMLMITIAIPFVGDIHEERKENINLIKCLAMNTPSDTGTVWRYGRQNVIWNDCREQFLRIKHCIALFSKFG